MPVDMLLNNAGLAHYMPFADLVAAQATELVDLNVLAPVLLTQAVLPGMLARSRHDHQHRLPARVQRRRAGPVFAQAGGIRGHQVVPGHLQPGDGG